MTHDVITGYALIKDKKYWQHIPITILPIKKASNLKLKACSLYVGVALLFLNAVVGNIQLTYVT